MDSPQDTPRTEGSEREDDPRSHLEKVEELRQQTQALLREGDQEAALSLFTELHPVDQGDVLLEMPPEPRQELLTALPPDTTAEILEHLDPEVAVEVSETLEPAELSQILDEISPDSAADILKLLPLEKSQATLDAMEESEEVIALLSYSDDTAGGVMTPDYPVLQSNLTAANALDQLRLLGEDAEDIYSFYVIDEEHKLLGSLSIARLALARPSALVSYIIDREIISVSVDTDQEHCARLMERYNLNQLPVVEADNRLVGVILAEDMVDVLTEEATEDMFRMAGVGEERALGTIQHSLRSRLPWLSVNLVTAFLAASVIGLFESTIARAVALAVFMPMVAGQGGIAGTQAVTLVVRSMALGEIPGGASRRVLARELTLGLIHGVLLGLVVGLIAFAWKGNFVLGIVLATAMLGNMLVAGLAGAGVPLLLRRLRLDPAVPSAVFVTTFTDVLGFLLFLGLAAAFISYLE